jgi:hypothetical protein
VNGDSLVRCLEVLCGLSLLIQVAEYLRIAKSSDPQGVWSWPEQRADIPPHPPLFRRLLDVLFQPQAYRVQLWLRAVLALVLMIQGSSLLLLLALFMGTLLLLVRWRGAFNGGSDFMTLVVLLGLFIAAGVNLLSAPNLNPALGWRAGFAFIALQAISSYFLSGSVKLLRPEWRNGRALTLFLNEAVRGPLTPGHWLRQAGLARLGSWAFILWECAFPLALLQAEWALLFCLVAAVFHFLVFWFFGLNRFFWAWLATFPAIIWCAAAHWN